MLLKLQLSVVLFLTAIIAIGSITPVFASGQLDVTIDSDEDIALAKMTYQRTISINYSEGGQLADELSGKIMRVSFHADSSNYGMSDLISNINSIKIIFESCDWPMRLEVIIGTVVGLKILIPECFIEAHYAPKNGWYLASRQNQISGEKNKFI